jgi:hypothetical protein
VDAIKEAGSVDTEEVMKVLDDPNFRFDLFWAENASLGGLETFGVRRQWPLSCDYGEILDVNTINLTIDMMLAEAP